MISLVVSSVHASQNYSYSLNFLISGESALMFCLVPSQSMTICSGLILYVCSGNRIVNNSGLGLFSIRSSSNIVSLKLLFYFFFHCTLHCTLLVTIESNRLIISKGRLFWNPYSPFKESLNFHPFQILRLQIFIFFFLFLLENLMICLFRMLPNSISC